MADRPPRLLDLFCGAGGAAMGYHLAGFDVTGVDVVDQPRYPFAFVQADATTFPLDGFDVIHASPPCQDHSAMRSRTGRDHGTGWMLAATIDRLTASGVPWIVENVDGADVGAYWSTVCGASLGLAAGGRVLKRHRRFASSEMLMVPPCACHGRQVVGVYGTGGGGPMTRGYKATRTEGKTAMGIDWMVWSELAQAIPPAYTELLGAQLIDALIRHG